MNTPPHTDSDSVAIVSVASAALARDLRSAEELRQQTTADSTQTAYEGDWRRFCVWARSTGATPLPADPAVVCAHLGWLAGKGYSVATIERSLAAIAHRHRLAGLDSPRGAHIVAETLRGIRRRVGVKRTKKAPFDLGMLAEVCGRLVRQDGTLVGDELLVNLRQRALLTVGWFCMLRSDNLVAIRREHVRIVRLDDDGWSDDDDHPNGLIVHLPGSKTDQLKGGRDVAVHAQSNEAVCPVRSLGAYLRAGGFAPTDRIFPISKRTVSRLIKLAVSNPEHRHTLRTVEDCASCMATAHQFASHSLRRGSATTQAKRGVPEREIMRQGGWKNERVMRGYIEYATLFENNPTKDLSDRVK